MRFSIATREVPYRLPCTSAHSKNSPRSTIARNVASSTKWYSRPSCSWPRGRARGVRDRHDQVRIELQQRTDEAGLACAAGRCDDEEIARGRLSSGCAHEPQSLAAAQPRPTRLSRRAAMGERSVSQLAVNSSAFREDSPFCPQCTFRFILCTIVFTVPALERAAHRRRDRGPETSCRHPPRRLFAPAPPPVSATRIGAPPGSAAVSLEAPPGMPALVVRNHMGSNAREAMLRRCRCARS